MCCEFQREREELIFAELLSECSIVNYREWMCLIIAFLYCLSIPLCISCTDPCIIISKIERSTVDVEQINCRFDLAFYYLILSDTTWVSHSSDKIAKSEFLSVSWFELSCTCWKCMLRAWHLDYPLLFVGKCTFFCCINVLFKSTLDLKIYIDCFFC